MPREQQVETFVSFFATELAKAVVERPDEYGFPVDEVPIVVNRMRQAFIRGSYNHDGVAIRRTCKCLGLKHTRTAMEAWFNA